MADGVDGADALGGGERASEVGDGGDRAAEAEGPAVSAGLDADSAAAPVGSPAVDPAFEEAAGADDGAGLDSDEWGTPQPLFDALNARHGPFEVDLFAAHGNAKCAYYVTKREDAYSMDWDRPDWVLPVRDQASGIYLGGSTCLNPRKLFGNPPYSRGMQGPAVRKARHAAEHGRKTVGLLVQSTTDKAWFHEELMAGADLVGKETILGGPLAGVLLRFEATRCFCFAYFLRGRVSFINPATGKVAGAGKQGALAVAFSPRLRW